MDIATTLSEINWFAVIAAALAAFALGAVWYSMPMFGRTWMREIGLSEETASGANMPLVFVTVFLLQLAAATALAACMPDPSNWLTGIKCGLVVGLFWVASAFAITYLFEQRSMRLFMINAGYYVVLFAIMGVILGSWR